MLQQLAPRFAAFVLAALCLLRSNVGIAAEIVFARDVLPILSDTCFHCHGPDAQNRQADLRLDVRDVALSELPSGNHAIVPGNLGESELIRRIQATGDEAMPPTKSLKQLTAAQKQTLQRWIQDGAKYQSHWAYTAPHRPELPPVKQEAWMRNVVDRFVLARLEKEGLNPSPEAAKGTLLRRLSLDLTGLPPTPAELAAFVADQSPDAYERVVDRLLASPRFGERLATIWLDVSRYADTNGYNNDEARIMWRWRDWVIDAFNRNLPFDQFTIEQLAGDLLPNPTLDQKIATGFNRNHVLTTEGGIIPEEYRVEYVADRAQTTANVFLGLTMQCARCHDHKFDPISQRDYYQFYAFFNQSTDKVYGANSVTPAEPYLKAPTPPQLAEQTALTAKKDAAAAKLAARTAEIDAPLAAWDASLAAADRATIGRMVQPAVLFPFDETAGSETFADIVSRAGGAVHGSPKAVEGRVAGAVSLDGGSYLSVGEVFAFDRNEPVSFGAWIHQPATGTMAVLSKMHDSDAFRGFDLLLDNGKISLHMIHHWPDNAIKVVTKSVVTTANRWHHLFVTYDGSSHAAGIKIYVDGILQPVDVVEDRLKDTIVTNWPLHLGYRGEGLGFTGKLDDVRFYRSALSPSDVASLAAGVDMGWISAALNTPSANRTAEQLATLRKYFLEQVDEIAKSSAAELAQTEQQLAALDKTIPTALIMDELPSPRETHILNRGQYDQPGDKVDIATPHALPTMAADLPKNRLGLARWLVQPDHPLTSRVAVNRWWAMLFGIGLVESEEDFGVQGSWPSHPELLDWLAVQYSSPAGSADGVLTWNTKALIRLIVTSATYRQSSAITPALAERDPANHLLARGPRFRLSAESVRDIALAIGGLLVERIGGASVMPYQPAGLWEEVSVLRRESYKQATDDGLYRRSMYTFWKRTCPPPAMSTFDAPDREVCVVRRARTNTPLQALVLMNDTTYVEAARKFAERILRDGGTSTSDRLRFAFQVAMSRGPQPTEAAVLEPMYGAALKRFTEDPAAAAKLLAVGAAKADANLNQAELAAWSVVASMLLNLDETISKE